MKPKRRLKKWARSKRPRCAERAVWRARRKDLAPTPPMCQWRQMVAVAKAQAAKREAR